MPHIQVLDWRDGRVICEGEYADVKELLEKNKDEISFDYAELNDAKLNGADINYSAWPLWCGSTQAIVDDRIKAQLLYHALCLVGNSTAIPQEMKGFVNSNFHRVKSGELKGL